MKIDLHLQNYPLTREQHFFAACWFNMVHASSLDSYRVRTMNPRNILRELIRICHPPGTPQDQQLVAAEAYAILSADRLLKTPDFNQPYTELIDLIAPIGKGAKDSVKVFESNKYLIEVFAQELLSKIDSRYVSANLCRLREVLIDNINVQPDEKERKEGFEEIQVLTGNLLSVLLDRGASLESLFQLYRQILVPRRNPRAYRFDRKLTLLGRIITQPAQKFAVTFAVTGISKPNEFPEQIGEVSFQRRVPNLEDPRGEMKRYVAPNPRKIFATIEVETQDHRTAGTKAYALINSLLDLVRFEYEREPIQVAEEFLIADAKASGDYRIFPIPKVIPNPAADIDAADLELFVQSVNELVSTGAFSAEGRNRVQSAFRLYRDGADTNTFENKLTNWWTAIEFLIKGTGAKSGGIGSAVEDSLTPVLGLGYITKHLLSFRNTLVDLKAQLREPTTGVPIQLRELSQAALYVLFSRPDMRLPILQAMEKEPFAQFKMERFLNDLDNAKSIAAMLQAHEQRVRWQIQRLWRARCDIVHSAERTVNAALLCANLEFYLKSILTSLLKALREIPTLETPREFFERQSHLYQHLKKNLIANSTARLEALLPT